MITKSSIALRYAHILYNEKPMSPNGCSAPVLNRWGDTVRYAWYFVHFRDWLRRGVVVFTYTKQNGEYREACGTCHPRLIPSENVPKNEHFDEDAKRKSTVVYYDIDRKEWRCFDVRRFLGFVTRYELTLVPRSLPVKEKEKRTKK
ncbi:MAG: DUF2693 domain-containing protein [Paludibacteraceae bacterium]|nr:DUF2693 domain-containing protein [Paludibacteraceae bacterium]